MSALTDTQGPWGSRGARTVRAPGARPTDRLPDLCLSVFSLPLRRGRVRTGVKEKGRDRKPRKVRKKQELHGPDAWLRRALRVSSSISKIQREQEGDANDPE